jgi:acylglycerol lipase
MQHSTGNFTNAHGDTIFTQAWLPDSPPRALILLAHGYAEHSERYTHVAAYLTDHGYAVYSLDHKGHGKSGGMPAMVKSIHEYVDDLTPYFERIRAENPGLPVFAYGHSMGSQISLLFALEHQDQLAGLITTGTVLKLPGANRITTPLLKNLSRVFPTLPLVALAAEGISTDPDVVRCYRADPLVYHKRTRLAMAVALQTAADDIIRRMPDLRLPYLALHGSRDPIALPSGISYIRERSGAPDTTIKVYEGLYHEIHNEREQQQVFGDIVAWLDAHLP